MTLKLQSPPVVPSPAVPAPTSGHKVSAGKRASLGNRLNRRATLLSVILVSCVAIAGSAIFRLPQARQTIAARARQNVSQTTVMSSVERARLTQAVAGVRAKLLPDRRAMLAELQQLEVAAVANGWSTDCKLLPAADAAPLNHLVQVLPVEIRLTDRARGTNARSAFNRLQPVIGALNLGARRIDIVKLEARAGPAGLADIDLGIQFWLDQSDEKDPAR